MEDDHFLYIFTSPTPSPAFSIFVERSLTQLLKSSVGKEASYWSNEVQAKTIDKWSVLRKVDQTLARVRNHRKSIPGLKVGRV